MITMQNETFMLQLSNKYNANKERVFQAWTKKDELKQWWGPEGFTTTIDKMDLVEGGQYRFVMHAPNGNDHVLSGKYIEIIPNEKLVFTWKWEIDGMDQKDTLVSIDFIEQQGATELVVTHENFDTKEEAEDHNNGWSSSLDGSFKKYIG